MAEGPYFPAPSEVQIPLSLPRRHLLPVSVLFHCLWHLDTPVFQNPESLPLFAANADGRNPLLEPIF